MRFRIDRQLEALNARLDQQDEHVRETIRETSYERVNEWVKFAQRDLEQRLSVHEASLATVGEEARTVLGEWLDERKRVANREHNARMAELTAAAAEAISAARAESEAVRAEMDKLRRQLREQLGSAIGLQLGLEA